MKHTFARVQFLVQFPLASIAAVSIGRPSVGSYRGYCCYRQVRPIRLVFHLCSSIRKSTESSVVGWATFRRLFGLYLLVNHHRRLK